MALVHDVTFTTMKEMVLEIAEIYTQFNEMDDAPTWWEKFKLWVEENDIEDLKALGKKIDEAEKAKDKPGWWKPAEKAFKDAKSVKVVTVKTQPFDGTQLDEDMRVSYDDGTDLDETEDEEPEDDEPEDDEPEDEEPEDDEVEEEPEDEEPEDDKAKK